MPHQPYFVVVLAHSLHGRLRRVHIPHKAIYAVLALAAVGLLTVLGFLGSYARMSWKVANYNNLRREVDALRTRYRDLERVNHQKDSQLATLQVGQIGSTVSIFAANVSGGSCNYSGTYTQDGHLGTVVGSFACTSATTARSLQARSRSPAPESMARSTAGTWRATNSPASSAVCG